MQFLIASISPCLPLMAIRSFPLVTVLVAVGLVSANPKEIRVFTFADQYHPMLCHLAHSVELAGGWLHVLGLRDGRKAVSLLKDIQGTEDKSDQHQWHFEDKFVMLKKHLFLYQAIKGLPANLTVIFVDAFDVLFQRPLDDIVEAYLELAESHIKQHGRWPVIYGGDLNCWPFPHNARIRVPLRGSSNRSWLHRIPADAALSASYHHKWRYPSRRGIIAGDEVCREWLKEHSDVSEAPKKRPDGKGNVDGKTIKRRRFPFVCAGTFIGRVSSLRRLLHKMIQLYRRTSEYHDQALIPLLLLGFPDLGFVDKDARLFLGLHGHDEFWDLERPLCRGNYFEATSHAASSFFRYFSAPKLLGSEHVPKLLHFNGNGKRHLWRCVEEFRENGLLGGEDDTDMCHYFDMDRNEWKGGPSKKIWKVLFSDYDKLGW